MRALRLLIPLALAAGFIAGCGGKPATPAPTATTPSEAFPGKSAAEIVDLAKAALAAAPSVHIKGTFLEEGKPMTIDVQYTKAHDGVGTMSKEGESFQIIKIGSDVYLKGDDAFMKSIIGDDETVAKLLKGKWIKGTGSDVADMAAFFNIADEIFKDVPSDLRRGDTGVINGIKALALVSTSDDGKMWVATEGEPYPLRLDAGADGTIDFTDYGATVDVKAPPASEVFDLSKIG
jgi:hypothetical protein